MRRLIDQMEAVEEIRQYITEPNISDDESEIKGFNDGLELAISVLSGMQIVEAVPKWIPVTEALPDRGKTVLITNDKGNVRSGRFRCVEFWKDDGDAYWTFKGNTVEHVLAWMPLPEPYKGGQDE